MDTPPTIRTGVAYYRASTEDQALSPEAQRSAIERWAASQHLMIVASFSDLGVSGAAPLEERPGLLAAINAVAQHHAQVLVVARRDRLARDVMIAGMVERLIERAGASVASADGAGNGTSPEAGLLRGIVDLFAQYERALIRARTRSALKVLKESGRVYCRIPFGFVRVGNRLVRDPRQEEALRCARNWHAEGFSYHDISKLLRAMHAKTPRGGLWYPASVRNMLLRGVA